MILLETALPADIYTRQNLFSFLLTYFNVWISTADSVIVLPVFCTAVQTLKATHVSAVTSESSSSLR
uniref:Uncharacterized protein n=1 Tax=Salix viminalis TaxID=40686 RepID=A0A6N2L409_SALVM